MKFKIAAIIAAICGIAGVSKADDSGSKKYDIYSWKDGNEWNYSVVPGGNSSTKADIELKQGGPLRGSSKVKEKILAMREGDKISWQERSRSGMVNPPDLVMEDINKYAQSVGVKPVAR